MDRFGRRNNFSPNPDPESNQGTSKATLVFILLDLLSLALGAGISGYSIFLLVRIYREACSASDSYPCEFFWSDHTTISMKGNMLNWKVFLFAAAIVGFIQFIVCLLFCFCLNKLKRWMNVWYAGQALIVVVFAPILVFSLISFRDPAMRLLDNFLTRTEQRVMIVTMGLDMCLSLVNIAVVTLATFCFTPTST